MTQTKTWLVIGLAAVLAAAGCGKSGGGKRKVDPRFGTTASGRPIQEKKLGDRLATFESEAMVDSVAWDSGQVVVRYRWKNNDKNKGLWIGLIELRAPGDVRVKWDLGGERGQSTEAAPGQEASNVAVFPLPEETWKKGGVWLYIDGEGPDGYAIVAN